MEKPNVASVRKDTVQSEDARENQVRGSSLDTSTSWARCAEELWKHEKDIIQDLKEGIDTLLLFAGLFSAVVTAFNVEFYKTLQPQPTDSTAQILMHISAQLSSFAVNSGSINSTVPGYPARYLESVSHLDIATNTLWFSALVISLAAASIGITIKQWLNNHVAGVPSNPRQSATAWYLRHTGFDQWHVEDIVNLMPILLQLSLMLFLVGLVLQFWKTSAVVAGMVLGQMVLLMAFAFGTAITPSLNPHSPYKSPMSRALYRLFRVWRWNYGTSARKLKRACAKWRAHWFSTVPSLVRQYTADFSAIENLPSWEDREDFELTCLTPNIEPVVVLDAAFKTLKGDFLDRVLQPFLRLAPLEIALPIFEHYCSKEVGSSKS
ncbi:uncharacterized protein LAESUDRAFT_701068 [Laetiporus sulphureus 93-53]|uniref:DUF6535 domain-containing protein n=1 Tax=Laetiporus sulphureus 93-53 TaxID=1314785 RepID=A0A165E330_9APHY|nr:uncharacterized protein LAESUDRAFT_701068 [Laetiporus sulphureus 93-53]KZT06148.1 hypothetical protein LAESUDRAFT_701068 [Laetiporus sulphureus 93-53]